MSDNEHLPPSTDSSPTREKGNQKASARKETPKPTAKKGGGIELTAVESLLFFNIVRYNKDPTAVDWEKVALYSNLKNAASAKVRFRQIQKKYGMEIIPTPGPSSSGNRKRKAATGELNDEDKDDAVDETPSKTRSAASVPIKPTSAKKKLIKKAAKKSVSKEEEEEQDDEEQSAEQASFSKSFGHTDPPIKQEPNVVASQSSPLSAGANEGVAAQGLQGQQEFVPAFHAGGTARQPQHGTTFPHPLSAYGDARVTNLQDMQWQAQRLRHHLEQQGQILAHQPHHSELDHSQQSQLQDLLHRQQMLQRSQPGVFGGASFAYPAGMHMSRVGFSGDHRHQGVHSLSQHNSGSPVAHFGPSVGTVCPADVFQKTGPSEPEDEDQAEEGGVEIKSEE